MSKRRLKNKNAGAGHGPSPVSEPYDADSRWIIENLPYAAFIVACDGANLRFGQVNRGFLELFDLTLDALSGYGLSEIDDFPFGETLRVNCDAARKAGELQTFEWKSDTGSGSRHLLCQLVPRGGPDEVCRQIMGTVTDRSSEREAERNMLYNALHDNLTGLANRMLFQQRLERALAAGASGGGSNCAVLVLNIDRFQLINQSLGHLAGDEFLLDFAHRLEQAIGARQRLSRISGDEFAVFLEDLQSLDDVEAMAGRLHAAMDEPFQIANTTFHASASIGGATTLLSPAYSEELISDAIFAMHRAKTMGRRRTEIFQREKHQAARSQFRLEIDLRGAVTAGQLSIEYQPIVEIASGEICAFEALTRWDHPDHGRIPPKVFVPIAEDTGIIVDIGRWTLRTALEQLAAWRREIPAAARIAMSVNVAKEQLETGNMREQLEAVLGEVGLKGRDLRIELTESAFYSDPVATARRLDILKKSGVLISLDDFGTGYSSLGYLQDFPLDLIKVDRSFVAEIHKKNNNAKLVEIIALLSKALDIPLVAEGIEDQAQLSFLRRLGCEMGQGFLYSPPVDAHSAAALIRAGFGGGKRRSAG